MSWIILFVAGLLEIGWAVGLKFTQGFTRILPSVVTLAFMASSMVLLAISLRTLPLGTAYAVWTGIGAVGTAAIGMAVFGEPTTAPRIACIAMILGGIVGLKLLSPH